MPASRTRSSSLSLSSESSSILEALAGRSLTFHSCVNVVSTFPGLYLVEKMGRRNLLLMGAIGMCICQYVVAITGTVAGTDDLSAQKVAIAFVCFYIFFFASSWGPVAWVVTGELFPMKVRAKALSMTTATNWLLNFALAYATPYMVNEGKGYANLQSKVFFVSHIYRFHRKATCLLDADLGLLLLHLYRLCVVYDLRDQRPYT